MFRHPDCSFETSFWDCTLSGWWQLKYCLLFLQKLGKIPNLSHIFQRGWFNHQLVVVKMSPLECWISNIQHTKFC